MTWLWLIIPAYLAIGIVAARIMHDESRPDLLVGLALIIVWPVVAAGALLIGLLWLLIEAPLPGSRKRQERGT